ncbi:MAG: transglutaminase family protein [Bacteroidia bacterium]
MKPSQLQALVQLLDDEDPQVQEAVRQAFYEAGIEVIPQLEKAWQESPSTLQLHIEEIVSELQTRHFTALLRKWREKGGLDLLEGVFLVAQLHYPGLQLNHYYNFLRRSVLKTWLEIPHTLDPIEKLIAINRQLYLAENFRPEVLEPYHPRFFFLNEVIDMRRGNPLTLGTLYLYYAQEQQLPVHMVSFEGYHALRYYDGELHFYIDPYNKGLFFTPSEVEQQLRRKGISLSALQFKPLSHVYIILHYLQGLRRAYSQAGELDKALKFQRVLDAINITFHS